VPHTKNTNVKSTNDESGAVSFNDHLGTPKFEFMNYEPAEDFKSTGETVTS
jgi:hypothetical protein